MLLVLPNLVFTLYVSLSHLYSIQILQMSFKEWEALMVEFCDIIGVRSVIEQPVNSRFFRHPHVAVPRMSSGI